MSIEIKIEGNLKDGWTATAESGVAEGATSYGHDLKNVLSELGSVIEVLSMREKRGPLLRTVTAKEVADSLGVGVSSRGLAAPQAKQGSIRVPPKCTCSYEGSEEMTRHAPLCAITEAGLNW